jgi:hypothetical protein
MKTARSAMPLDASVELPEYLAKYFS